MTYNDSNQAGRVRRALTYANVMASVAVFVALGGGAYAVIRVPANSVGTRQLRRSAVTLSRISVQTQRSLRGPSFMGSPAGGDLTGTYPDPKVSRLVLPRRIDGYASVSGADRDVEFISDQGLQLGGTCHQTGNTMDVDVVSDYPDAELSWVRFSHAAPSAPDVSATVPIGSGKLTVFSGLTGDGSGTLIYHRQDLVLSIPFAYRVVQNGAGTICRLWGTATGA